MTGELMPPKLPPYVTQVRNKIGRPYLYFQRGRGTANAGVRHRLPEDPKSPEFWSEYARLSGLPVERPSAKSVAALVSAWHASPEWHCLAPSTRELWGAILRPDHRGLGAARSRRHRAARCFQTPRCLGRHASDGKRTHHLPFLHAHLVGGTGMAPRQSLPGNPETQDR
jgi:hypothetical protein